MKYSVSGTFIHHSTCIYYTLMTSLVAQMVKRLPTMRETWVQSLPWVRKISWASGAAGQLPAHMPDTRQLSPGTLARSSA